MNVLKFPYSFLLCNLHLPTYFNIIWRKLVSVYTMMLSKYSIRYLPDIHFYDIHYHNIWMRYYICVNKSFMTINRWFIIHLNKCIINKSDALMK